VDKVNTDISGIIDNIQQNTNTKNPNKKEGIIRAKTPNPCNRVVPILRMPVQELVWSKKERDISSKESSRFNNTF